MNVSPNGTQMFWLYVWMTPDGPDIGTLQTTREAAMDEAFEEWLSYEGGNLGGYEHGTRDEFDAMYAESGDLWIANLRAPA